MTIMKTLKLASAKKVYPTGNPNFSVMQAFPAGFNEFEVDPFLMCDYIMPTPSKGIAEHEDDFPIGWHPHIGMDICTYLKQGIGRHADSMGNRGTFETPGMQWISVGNGIEHAEGGGTPKGQMEEGFQLWFNTPKEFKKKDPTYGTGVPGSIPVLSFGAGEEFIDAKASLLAGKVKSGDNSSIIERELEGPFKTAQPIQVLDFELGPSVKNLTHQIPSDLDQCVLFVYKGAGEICGTAVDTMSVILLDAESKENRTISLSSSGSGKKGGMKVILFAGKKIKEPIAWRGPFVMNTGQEILDVMIAYQKGEFPPKRTPWDYRDISSFPKPE